MEYQSAKQTARDEFKAQMKEAFKNAPLFFVYGTYLMLNWIAEEYVKLLGMGIRKYIHHEQLPKPETSSG